LGTGGAIRLACQKAEPGTVLVLNGDTFFGVRVGELAAFHEKMNADCTLCLKPMEDFDRYGVVELKPDQGILHFREKQYYKTGLINGGVYALDTVRFLGETFRKNSLLRRTTWKDRSPGGVCTGWCRMDIYRYRHSGGL